MTEPPKVTPFAVLRNTVASECQCLTWFPNRTHLFCGYSDGSGQLWSLAERRVTCTLSDIHSTDGGVIHCCVVRSGSDPDAGDPNKLLLITQGKEGLVKVWSWLGSSLSPTPVHVLTTGAYGFCKVAALHASLPTSSASHHHHSHAVSTRDQGEPSTSAAAVTAPKKGGGLSALLAGERRQSRDAPEDRPPSAAAAQHPPPPPRLLVVHSCETRGTVRVTDAMTDTVVVEWTPPADLVPGAASSVAAELGMGMLMSLEATALECEGGRGARQQVVVFAGYEDGGVLVLTPSRSPAGGSVLGLDFLARIKLPHDAVTSLAVTCEDRTRSRPTSASATATSAAPSAVVLRGAAGSTTSEVYFFKVTLTRTQDPWFLDTCKLESRGHLQFPTPGLNDIRIRLDGKLVTTAGWDGKVRIFDLRRSKALAILKYHAKPATAIAYPLEETIGASTEAAALVAEHSELTSDGLFATCGRDGAIGLWDLYARGVGVAGSRSATNTGEAISVDLAKS